MPQYTDDVMLAAVGGVLQGFWAGSCVNAWLYNRWGGYYLKNSSAEIPSSFHRRIILIIDALVLSATAIVYQSLGNHYVLSNISLCIIKGNRRCDFRS